MDGTTHNPQWLTWESVILSEQMSARQVQDLLAEEIEFAKWLRARAEHRQGGR